MSDFVIYPHAALGRPAVRRAPDAAMIATGARLLEATSAAQAYGLAAAHLGLDEPLVVISFAEDRAQRDYRILYNPEVIAMAGETALGMEGSVSMPGIEVPVSRAVWVEISYMDQQGERHVLRLTDFGARVAQHEIDQVNGLFFLRRVSPLKRDMALRKFQKIVRS